MIKLGSLAFVIALALTGTACSPAPILPSAPIPTLPPLPSLVPPATATLAAAATSVPSPTIVAPTASPSSGTSNPLTQTLAARASITGNVTATATRAGVTPPTATSAPTSAAAGVPPGVYVLDLKIDPDPPKRTADLVFTPSFVNSTTTVQNYRWRIFIFKGDNPTNSTGDTTPIQSAFPLNQSDQKSGSTWKAGAGQCEVFIIRIAWLDQDNRRTYFLGTDGKVYSRNLYLCN